MLAKPYLKKKNKLGMVVQIYNTAMWEVV
jgi:hypothetical protein